MKILVTGSLGFIGFHLVQKLIDNHYQVVGIDNINSYYDVRLKYDKLPILGIEEANLRPNQLFQSKKYPQFRFAKMDITDRYQIEELFRKENFDVVINLAAQAGVQYSIQNPHTYVENNITGFMNLLDAAKTNQVKHFVFASSSSVYGNRDEVPFRETDNVDHPISMYAASKKSNELMAFTYSHLYNLKCTGLRFFTVYGPWGRPDMAPFIFTKNIMEGKKITVFNKGNLERDFTYVDDIVEGVFSVVKNRPAKDYVYNIYNIGNAKPVHLMDFIHTLEERLNKKARIQYAPLRKGDVFKTYAATDKLQHDFGYRPQTDISQGTGQFVDWYVDYFKKE